MCFAEALAGEETGEALEGLSWAAWWVDDVEACFDLRERAYRRYREAGDLRGAARLALWLGDDYLEFRGEHAVAGGWTQRAARLLEELDPVPEHGWLAVFEAHAALGGGDTALARRLAGEARELGRRLGAVDLEMFAVATEGAALVADGEVAAGMRRLDEAAAAALGGEYEDLRAAGWTCCYLIGACEKVRDFGRAAQWCREVEAFSRRLDIRFVTGVCETHYGAVLTWRGEWDAAERVLRRRARAADRRAALLARGRGRAPGRAAPPPGPRRRGARAVRRGRAPPARPARARGAQPRPRRGRPGARGPRTAAAPHPGHEPGRARRAGRGAGPGGGGGRRPRRRGRARAGAARDRRGDRDHAAARRGELRRGRRRRRDRRSRRGARSLRRRGRAVRRRPARRWRRRGPGSGSARPCARSGARRPASTRPPRRGRPSTALGAERRPPRPRSPRASSRCSASSPTGSAIAPSPSASRSASTRSTATSPTSTPSCAAPRAPPPSRSRTGAACSSGGAVGTRAPRGARRHGARRDPARAPLSGRADRPDPRALHPRRLRGRAADLRRSAATGRCGSTSRSSSPMR